MSWGVHLHRAGVTPISFGCSLPGEIKDPDYPGVGGNP